MFFFIILFSVVIFIVFLKLRQKSYENFVINHSQALNELKKLNDKYPFIDIIQHVERHTYDNEKYYNNISCEDYLIYQLQFTQNAIRQEIDKVNYNKIKFSKYCEELAKINCFGKFDQHTKMYNEKVLRSIETKIFTHEIKTPVTKYEIRVILKCSTLNGRVYAKKDDIFNAEQIKIYIRRINDKNGNYFKDRAIWDSICRVERGKVSNKMRFSIYRRDGYRCQICGRTDHHENLEIDHIKPIAKGGKSTYDNLQTLCKRCNKEKGDKY